MMTPTRVGIWRVGPGGGTEDFASQGRLVAPDVVLTYLPQSDEIVQQANRASGEATDSQSNGLKARLGLVAGGAEELVEVIDVASVETQEVPDTDEVLVALELERRSRTNAPYE